ncbi:hypothetical protein A1OE_698 [Candidatus Endolissoclinum faulkneri L2]|uniref:Uncharacterized protein n=1 Tax=Candidatus Endolissoclinum faulkneri L2 TaxID=1193729 RepID=K7ZCT3_9PROT|nr:hypothetical protein A1OE_698 [Candidatus Endolissoclinum faulkneri L2]
MAVSLYRKSIIYIACEFAQGNCYQLQLCFFNARIYIYSLISMCITIL